MRKRRNLQFDLTLYKFEGYNLKFGNIGQNKFSKTKTFFLIILQNLLEIYLIKITFLINMPLCLYDLSILVSLLYQEF